MKSSGFLRLALQLAFVVEVASCGAADAELGRAEERALIKQVVDAYWAHDFTVAIVHPFVGEHVEAQFMGDPAALQAYQPDVWGRRQGTLERILDSWPLLRTSSGVEIVSGRHARSAPMAARERPVYIAVGRFVADSSMELRVLTWYLGPDGHRSHTYVYTFRRGEDGAWEIVDSARAA